MKIEKGKTRGNEREIVRKYSLKRRRFRGVMGTNTWRPCEKI